MRVLIFARVSKTDGSQSNDRQVRDLMDFAKVQGWEVVETIQEAGSGTRLSISKRPAALELLRLASNGAIDMVLIHELPRLSRRPRDLETILGELEDQKIPLYIYKHKLQTLREDGTRDPLANLMITVIKEIAALEVEDLGFRVKSGLANARAKGVQLGRPEGTKENPQAILDKYPKIVKLLDSGISLREVSLAGKVSLGTVQRVKRALKEVSRLHT